MRERHEVTVPFKNREHELANSKEYGNRPEVKARVRARGREIKQIVISNLGGKCACCGETEPRFLTVEHIGGGGNQHRKQYYNSSYAVYRAIILEGYPRDKYEVLCWNCNMVQSHGVPCPHKALATQPFAL